MHLKQRRWQVVCMSRKVIDARYIEALLCFDQEDSKLVDEDFMEEDERNRDRTSYGKTKREESEETRVKE